MEKKNDKTKKYEYLNNLGKKISKFISDEIRNQIGTQLEELERKIKENNEKEKKYQDRLEYMKSKDMDDITYVYAKLKDEFEEFLYEKEETEAEYEKLKEDTYNIILNEYEFDEEKFYVFLQNVLKIPVDDIRNLFDNNLNENLYYGENIKSYIKEIISDYSEDFGKQIEKSELAEIIQNRYNANVNCFNETGKYIKKFDCSRLNVEDPTVYLFGKYADVCGLIHFNDIYEINDMCDVVEYSEVKSIMYGEDGDFAPKEYAYGIFYKNPDNAVDKIKQVVYMREKFEQSDFSLVGAKFEIYDEVIFDSSNMEIFKEVVDSIDSFVKKENIRLDDYCETEEEAIENENKIKEFVGKMNEKYAAKRFADADNASLSKSNEFERITTDKDEFKAELKELDARIANKDEFNAKLIEFLREFLTDEEYIVMTSRFGIEDGKPKSLEDVSKLLGVTTGKIRMFEANALRKLKSNMSELDKRLSEIGINLDGLDMLTNNNSETGRKR